MNGHEAERIAHALNALRPDWPTTSVLTLIRTKLANRPRRDVAVALTWVACDSETKTPARVLEPGPWWRAVAVDGETTTTRLRADEQCDHCGLGERGHNKVAAHDPHDFITAAQKRPPTVDPEKRDQLVNQTHQTVAATAPPPITEPPPVARCQDADCIRGADHTGPCLPPAEGEGARESGRDGVAAA